MENDDKVSRKGSRGALKQAGSREILVDRTPAPSPSSTPSSSRHSGSSKGEKTKEKLKKSNSKGKAKQSHSKGDLLPVLPRLKIESILDLPDELIQSILSYFNEREILYGCYVLVCSRFHRLLLAGKTTLDFSQFKNLSSVYFRTVFSQGTFLPIRKLVLNRSSFVDGPCLELISTLPKLAHLALQGCRDIVDKDLVHLTACDKLEFLDLSFNFQLTSVAMESVARIISLVTLDLTFDSSLGNAGALELTTLTNLKTLLILACGLTDEILPQIFSSLENLTDLDIGAMNHLESNIVHIANLPKLTSLNLKQSRGMNNIALESLSKLTELTSLVLLETGVNSANLGHYSTLSKLKKLSLQSCPSIDDSGLEILPRLVSLETLGFGENFLGADTFVQVGKLTNLKTLSCFKMAHIDDGCVLSISTLTALETFSVNACLSLTDVSLQIIGGLSSLTSLYISNTRVSTLSGLQGLPNLTELFAAGLSIDFDWSDLKHLPALKSLHLEKNTWTENLDSSIPHTISSLHLGGVVLKKKNFDCFWKLKGLKLLSFNTTPSLSWKHLEPIQIMTQLSNLDLRFCVKLSSKAIGYFERLANLELIDVSGCTKFSSKKLRELLKPPRYSALILDD